MFGIVRKIVFAVFGNPEAEELRQALLCLQREQQLSEKQARDLKRSLEALHERLKLVQHGEQFALAENVQLKLQVAELEDLVTELKEELKKRSTNFEDALDAKQAELDRVLQEAEEAAEEGEKAFQELQEQMAASDSLAQTRSQEQMRALQRQGAEIRQLRQDCQKHKEVLEFKKSQSEKELKELSRKVAEQVETIRKLEEDKAKQKSLISSYETLNRQQDLLRAQNSETIDKLEKKNERLNKCLAEYRKGEHSLVCDVAEFSVGLIGRQTSHVNPSAAPVPTSDGDN